MSHTEERIQEFVFNALTSFGPELADINLQASLESLDIDSLDLIELGQLVEEEYGVRLKGEDFKDVETVGQAIDVIVGKVR